MTDLHCSIEHVPGPGTEPCKVWLNDLNTADGIVRQFCAGLMRRLGGDSDALGAWVQDQAQSMNGLFLGIVPSETYSRGPWNMPDQCGAWVRRALGSSGDNRTGVRDAFAWLAFQVMDVVKDAGAAPPDTWMWRVEGLIEQVSYALLGLPFGDD